MIWMYYYNILGENLLLIYRFGPEENQNVEVGGDGFFRDWTTHSATLRRHNPKEHHSNVDELRALKDVVYSYELE
jgi:hypothetical protein